MLEMLPILQFQISNILPFRIRVPECLVKGGKLFNSDSLFILFHFILFVSHFFNKITLPNPIQSCFFCSICVFFLCVLVHILCFGQLYWLHLELRSNYWASVQGADNG